MNIRIHIERLILDGLPLGPGDGARVQAAIEAEIARLLAESSTSSHAIAEVWPAGGAVPGMPAAPIQLPTGARPSQMGAQIARSIYGSIGGKS